MQMIDFGDLRGLVEALIAAGAVYGGVRADLKNLRERIEEVRRSATRAHERLDDHCGARHG
jgi:hypothetical protein